MSALQSGARVGSYEVLSLVGTGGMGEVYRARDTKLKRDVAIKVLPSAVAGDPDRVARLRREAEMLAALNHPHIAQIYGLEDVAGLVCLMMELVEGETLADRIARGPAPINDALTLARQIAEALEAAHEKGITHRDLKPANITVTRDGVVKVLDFGLAKVAEPEAVPDVSTSPTAMPSSSPGMIPGTAVYMSPEQARGEPVDKRTDIWSFGALLYELVTGQRAFPGATVSDVLAAVLRAEPDWSRLPADTPAGLRRLLQRCLQKERGRRLRDIADERFQIEDALNEPSTAGVAARPAGRNRERAAWAAAASFLLAAVFFATRPSSSVGTTRSTPTCRSIAIRRTRPTRTNASAEPEDGRRASARRNLLTLPIDRYDDESIGVHEFCHTVDGALRSIDSTWTARRNAAHQNAREKGLYQWAYAQSNAGEYWGEICQTYFDTQRVNNWNHNFVGTREQLKEYDPIG